MQLDKSQGASYLQEQQGQGTSKREGKLRAATTQAGQQPRQEGSAPQHQSQASTNSNSRTSRRQFRRKQGNNLANSKNPSKEPDQNQVHPPHNPGLEQNPEHSLNRAPAVMSRGGVWGWVPGEAGQDN